jgi:Nup85 Nucleoporin
MSRRAVNQKQLGDALMWAVKADNHGLASSISELVLREMAKNESFTVANVLSDLSSCIACSEYLAFLGEIFIYFILSVI